MKLNKILIATLLLLAILSIGVVSASDTDDSSYLSSSDDAIIAADDFDDGDDWEDDDGDDDDDEDEDLYVFSNVDGENIYYTADNTEIAYLKDLPSTAAGSFSIFEGDCQLATKTVVNGKASFILSELEFPLNLIGDHDLYAQYDDGDDTYGRLIHITVIDYKITPQATNVALGENVVFTVSLPSTVNGEIHVFENDEFIKSVNVINGVATVSLPGVLLGNHEFEFLFDNDDYYLSDFLDVVVAPQKIATVSKAYIGADNFFTVTLPGNANGFLSVELKNTKTHKTIWIDDVKYTNGKAVIPASMLAAGTYEITDFFIEDKKYGDYYFVDLPSYVDGAVFAKFEVVYPPISFGKISALKKTTKSVTLKVTVGKNTGKSFKGNKVTFKFKTKTYTRTLNSNGYAQVIIKNSVFKNFKVGKSVNYQVTYYGKTIKRSITFKSK